MKVRRLFALLLFICCYAVGIALPQHPAEEHISRQHADAPSWESVGMHNILSPGEETTITAPTSSGQITGRNNNNPIPMQQRILQQRAALQAPQQAGALRSSLRPNITVPSLAVDYYVYALLRLRC